MIKGLGYTWTITVKYEYNKFNQCCIVSFNEPIFQEKNFKSDKFGQNGLIRVSAFLLDLYADLIKQ